MTQNVRYDSTPGRSFQYRTMNTEFAMNTLLLNWTTLAIDNITELV